MDRSLLRLIRRGFGLVLPFVAGGSVCAASTIYIAASDYGSYNSAGFHDPVDASYFAGRDILGGLRRRNWFAFEIPTLPGPITSAHIRINTYSIDGPDGEVMFGIYDVTNSASAIAAGGGSLVSIYNDLATGVFYGIRTFQTSQSNQFRIIPLNQSFRSAAEAAAGATLVVGGGVITNLPGDAFESLFKLSPTTPNPGDVQLILGFNDSPVVGYFTDLEPASTGPNAPILAAGFLPLHIQNIATQELALLDILVINEANNDAPSPALQQRLPEIETWVRDGGRLIVHDRSAGNVNPNPFLPGTPGTVTVRLASSDIEPVDPANSFVTAGPFGSIDSAALDGGCDSVHGYVHRTNLPHSSRAILGTPLGAPGEDNDAIVAFSYQLGAGFVYYAAIPIDYYLEGGTCPGPNNIGSNAAPVYFPNVLTYMRLLDSPVVLSVVNAQGGTFDLVAASWDGSAISSDRALQITVLASTNVVLPEINWTPVLDPRVLTNGILRIPELPLTPGPRFFRAVEPSL